MFRTAVIVAAVVVLAAVAVLGLTHRRGADDGTYALAIRGTHTIGFSGATALEVECADHVRVEVRDDPAGTDLPEVTVWGRPRIGRCQPGAALLAPLALQRWADPSGRPPTKIVDGATSQVVSLD